MTAKPFLKWAGGKSKLYEPIVSCFPRQIGTYYEPFLGAGAVALGLMQDKRFSVRSHVLSDANRDLIATWGAVVYAVEPLISSLQWLATQHKTRGQNLFEEARSKQAGFGDLGARAPRFIYLNKTCFNGLYRVNKTGDFNVPYGRHENPTICDAENLKACSDLLGRGSIGSLELSERDFEQAVVGATSGDVVYMDPPYVPVSKTSSFTAYEKTGFGFLEQIRLARVARALAARGVRVVLSNADAPIVHDLYWGFDIRKVHAGRSINSNGEKRGKVAELLILGGPNE